MRLRLLQHRPEDAIVIAQEEIAARGHVQPVTDPDRIEAVTRIGSEFEKCGDSSKAEQWYRTALAVLGEKRPDDLKSLAFITYWMASTGEYGRALDTLRLIRQHLPTDRPDQSLSCRSALLALLAGRPTEFAEARLQLLAMAEVTKDARNAAEIARICLLDTSSLPPEETHALDQLMSVIQNGSGSLLPAEDAWLELALGQYACRLGHDAEALEHLHRAAEHGAPPCQATAKLFCALIQGRRGEGLAGRQLLAEADRLMAAAPGSKFSWWDQYLFFRLVRSETARCCEDRLPPIQ